MRGTAVGGLVVGVALALTACGSSGSDGGATKRTTSTRAGSAATNAGRGTGPLRVLVTNDDGYAADGIDALVQALRSLPGVQVTVVAPLKNQSGTGDKTTAGTLTASEQRTKSGYAATAVDGYPADSVTYALDTLMKDSPPHLVVSGVNFGQNFGPLASLSGTVGAARTAVRRGIPAVATSTGPIANPDFAHGASFAAAWVRAHRSALLAGNTNGLLDVVNINVPGCGTTGTLRGVKQVPIATGMRDRDANAVNCASTVTDPPDDVGAFLDGYVAVTELTVDLETVTTTTTLAGGWPAVVRTGTG